MYIPWKWIDEKITYKHNYSIEQFIEQLNHHGLECEKIFTGEFLFINFITAHNRKDLKSWWGLLREISILLNLKKDSSFLDKAKDKNKWLNNSIGDLQFMIESKRVIGYNLISLHDLAIKNEKLPIWISQSLIKNGIKNVNTIVDIANFVTLETGQSLHVFDLKKLQNISLNNKVVIKEARGGEIFIDLFGRERKLFPGNLIMEINQEIVEILGVIGGKNVAVDQTTKHILVESANLLPIPIETSYNNSQTKTRASKIFINYYNQESSKNAIKRFKEVIGNFYNYQENKTAYFSFLQEKKQSSNWKIEVDKKFFTKKLGMPVSQKKIETLLQRLGFNFESTNSLYVIEVPSFRSDIRIKEDLLEEISKFLDYNLLPAKLPAFQNEFIDQQFNNFYTLKKKIATYFMSNGYQEILSYSLTKNFGQNDKQIFLSNPKSNEHVVYRTSFVNSHLSVISYNQSHGKNDLFLFEIGNIYSKKNKSVIIKEEIISAIATGRMINSHIHKIEQLVDIYWIKGIFENLLEIFNISNFTIEKAEFAKNNDLDYQLLVNRERIGFIRQFSSQTLAQNKIKNFPCFLLQISLSKILTFLNKQIEKKYFPVSYLPIVTKNISFLVAKNIPLNKIKKLIKEKGGKFLSEISLVDIYDENKEKFLYSLNYKLLFQGINTNLKNSEIEVKIESIWKSLIEKFSVLRR